MRSAGIILLIILTFFMGAGCTLPNNEIEKKEGEQETLPGYNGDGTEEEDVDEKFIVEEKSELFVMDETGALVFLLNDMNYQEGGYTFWKYLDQKWEADKGMTMELVKESGNYLGGYGYFFASEYVAGYGQIMLVLLIQIDGNFAIGKAIEGVYEELVSWRSSDYLRKGYGVKNDVEVRWDNDQQEYVVTINGIVQARFVDVREPVCAGTRTGIVAVVTRMEQFPQTPVKVGYR